MGKRKICYTLELEREREIEIDWLRERTPPLWLYPSIEFKSLFLKTFWEIIFNQAFIFNYETNKWHIKMLSFSIKFIFLIIKLSSTLKCCLNRFGCAWQFSGCLEMHLTCSHTQWEEENAWESHFTNYEMNNCRDRVICPRSTRWWMKTIMTSDLKSNGFFILPSWSVGHF